MGTLQKNFELSPQQLIQTCESFKYFLNNIFPASFTDEEFVPGKHLNLWADMLQNSPKTCILAPRKHSKSVTMYAWLLWQHWRRIGENWEVLYISYKQSLAAYHIKNYKRLIENNPYFRQLMDMTDAENMARYSWDREHFHVIEPEGILSVKRGRHPNTVVLDDCLSDPTTMLDLGVVEKINQRVMEEVMSMPKEGGEMKIIGCVGGDTLLCSDNGMIRIDNFWDTKTEGMNPININVKGYYGEEIASDFFIKKEDKTLKIRTQHGYHIECSGEHPLCIMDEDGMQKWKSVRDIKIGDYVAIKPGTNSFGNISMPVEEAYLIGLYISEGYMEPCGRLIISSGDEEIIQYLIDTHGFIRQEKFHVRKQSTELRNKMLKFGMKFVKSYEKEIPTSLWMSNREIQKAILQGMFDGDGSTIRNKDGKTSICYYSSSEKLIDQVQIILLNFGIVTSKYSSPVRKRKVTGKWDRIQQKHINYLLKITGRDRDKFYEDIGFRLKRKQQFTTSNSGHVIPYQGRLISKVIIKRSGGICDTINYDKKITHTRLNRFLKSKNVKINKEYFQLINNARFLWDKIKDIKESYNKTFDIVVPKTHSFIGNGFLNHNTAQSPNDFFFKLKENPKFEWGEFPAITNTKLKQVLWPQKFPWERLMEIKNQEIGEKAFEKEYMIRPVWSADTFFRKEQIMLCVNPELKSMHHLETKNEVGMGWDVGKHSHPAHISIFEFIPIGEGKDLAIQRFQVFMDGWEYHKQLEYAKELAHNLRVDYCNFDNTRGELEGFYEKHMMDTSIFHPINLNTKSKTAMASEFEKRVTNKDSQERPNPTIQLLNHERMINQILTVTNDLQSITTREGHSDSFWSIALALFKKAGGRFMILGDPDNLLGLS